MTNKDKKLLEDYKLTIENLDGITMAQAENAESQEYTPVEIFAPDEQTSPIQREVELTLFADYTTKIEWCPEMQGTWIYILDDNDEWISFDEEGDTHIDCTKNKHLMEISDAINKKYNITDTFVLYSILF